MSWRYALIKSVGPSAFAGVTFGQWLRVLRENHFAVDLPYWPRTATITSCSLLTSVVAAWESLRYRRQIAAAKVDPPVFVLGIWRSGTTHLHNLLCHDERFAYPNTYQVTYPSTFLTTERTTAKLLGFLVPRQRPMDNVSFGFKEPQEDEFALAALIGGYSLGWVFPRHAEFYNRFLTLRDVSASELAEWKATLMWFLQKLTLKYRRPLVLKSPAHTCRIQVLLDMFPEAKFVHIRRNPFDVFRSAEHLMRTGISPIWALQRPDPNEQREWIFRQYREVYDAYFEQRELIPTGHLHEISYEDLEADPMRQLQEIYEGLALPDFHVAQPAMQRYLDSLAGYKKNVHSEIPRELRDRIVRDWRRSFDEWGYALDSSEPATIGAK